ncbi:MAG: sulfotransferase family protein [Mycobacteriales bacterium]
MVFVGGLHRSGTTPLARCLAAHPLVSGFSGTGVREDEGQHLQGVYPPVRTFGGAGRFAFAPAAHLTERSPLATGEAGARLYDQWRQHWDLSRPVLVEKSPPNLIMTRFLQSLFPDARFVIVVRHPVVVTLSTRKWARRVPLGRLMEHWFHAHDLFATDAPQLRHVQVVKYEDLVRQPERTLAAVGRFLELAEPPPADTLQRHRSSRYEQQWLSWASSRQPWLSRRYRRLCRRYEDRAGRYGYSMRDLAVTRPFPVR